MATVLEMLQHANQYIVAEALVVGKREEHKRPRTEQPRGQPSGPPRRKLDWLEPLLPRPPPCPLGSSKTEIFLQIREKGLLRAPNLMKTLCELKDRSKYCRFQRDYGHNTKDCHDLKNQIKELIRRGHLTRIHLADLSETFHTLRRFDMRLNLAKCVFGVSSGKFLSFIIHQQGIDANPKKI